MKRYLTVFYQTDGDKKDSFGIGLHLSREIFRMHQGTVRVLESDETGTTFQILLPIFTAKDAGAILQNCKIRLREQ